MKRSSPVPLFVVGPLSLAALVQSGWEEWTPVDVGVDAPPTHYEVVDLEDGPCMRAVADASASALALEIEVDLVQTPILQWSWRADRGVEGSDLGQREGDDLTARVYVNFAFDSQRASFWERIVRRVARLRYGDQLPGSAINYGWAEVEPIGWTQSNVYAEQVQVVIVRNAEDVGEGWFVEERNVLDDYRQLFGADAPPVISLGIMSDTDNTGSHAEACYRDVRLVPQQ